MTESALFFIAAAMWAKLIVVEERFAVSVSLVCFLTACALLINAIIRMWT